MLKTTWTLHTFIGKKKLQEAALQNLFENYIYEWNHFPWHGKSHHSLKFDDFVIWVVQGMDGKGNEKHTQRNMTNSNMVKRKILLINKIEKYYRTQTSHNGGSYP